MKYVILVPVYNDRESLKLLIENINNEIKGLNAEISLVVINDASSQQIIDEYPNIELNHMTRDLKSKKNIRSTQVFKYWMRLFFKNGFRNVIELKPNIPIAERFRGPRHIVCLEIPLRL